MKKFFCLLLVLCISPVFALADQADDLIATLTKDDRAAVYIALVTADANHRSGQPYTLSIRLNGEKKEFTFAEEEYEKLKLWSEGKYTGIKIERNVSAQEWTTNWRNDNGYDFPIYGATTADLSPISDYLALLHENSILLSLPELQISAKTDYDWISSDIGSNFWLLYRPYHDGSKYSFQLQLPYTYLPMDDAFTLLLVSTLSMDVNEASALLTTLRYNIIDETCEMKADEYTVTYSEPHLSNGKLADFAVLEVVKTLK